MASSVPDDLSHDLTLSVNGTQPRSQRGSIPALALGALLTPVFPRAMRDDGLASAAPRRPLPLCVLLAPAILWTLRS